MKKIVIHPVTRIEGHLRVEAVIDNGEVKDANMSGTLFRGIEMILKGRDPKDAVMITQRICGVCPEPHAMASVGALEEYLGITDKIPDNAILVRNIIQATRTIADHILHFYILSGLDYIDVSKVLQGNADDEELDILRNAIEQGYTKPFFPRNEIDYKIDIKTNNEIVSNYLKALDIYRKAQEAATIFGGKWPHDCSIVGGGISENLTSDKIYSFIWRLKDIENFVKNCYLPDVFAVAKAYDEYTGIGTGCKNLLAFGSYKIKSNGKYNDFLFAQGLVNDINKYSNLDIENISEEVTHSWFKDTPPLNPIMGITEPAFDKAEAYSWIKSPRYNNDVYEVGPLASLIATYLSKENPFLKNLVETSLSEIGGGISVLYSVIGRHLARAIMASVLANNLKDWVQSLKVGEPASITYTAPEEGKGIGLWAAPRGALSHWLNVKEGRISNYQVITPTGWNASPRDRDGKPGPIEQALIGLKIKDIENPIEILRVIRSFDPCLACAVHLLTPTGRLVSKYKAV